MSKRLSKYEQETIINFNKAEDKAYIFTYEKAWQRYIEKKLGIKAYEDNGFGGRSYEVPKKSIRPPIAPRKLSAETRMRLAEGARTLHQKRRLKASSLMVSHI